MCGKIILGFCILHFALLLVNNVEASDNLRNYESLDEQNDAEIFAAVVRSMNDWESKKRHRRGHRKKREVSRVCYEDVGCFEDTGPFSYLEMLPSPPKEVGTRFFVYGHRKARSIPMEVPAESISDQVSHTMDGDLPTKILVHGFGSSCDQVWVYEIRAALRAVMECNIVCVDWGPGSAVPNYVRAAANTRLVGRQLAKLVRSLNVPLDKVHLIGFSLGAHVAGFAGAELGNVSRITGLDPAGPLFEAQDPRARLDETDAQFVDVIHSNGEQLILGGLGSWQPMGDVDFYPNGGRMQTGCSNIFFGAVSDIIWSNPVEGRSLCNHRRAYKLFTDSVSPKCRFPAFPCDKGYEGLLKGECFPCGTDSSKPCGDMGFYADKSAARGQLFLVTRDEEPFCAYQYQIKVYNSKHERPVKSYGKLQVTLLTDGSLNETFTMTKKDDEELLVGATLQKIVVPHPALSNLDAIEIKYTAYSGWISSGLVSWAIDKISVTDSYGTIYSVCKRGLVLVSGRPVYVPLYRGDCSIPPEKEDDKDEDESVADASERVSEIPPPKEESKSQGIGPFTKEHNYDRSNAKDGFTNEVPQKGLGPFTKEQNIKIANEQTKLTAIKDYTDSPSKNYPGAPNPWTVAELTNDGNSNSVENNIGDFAERGRGFSGGSSRLHSPVTLDRVMSIVTVSTNPRDDVISSTEIQEPILRLGSGKKETARSLRLPEITEPVLRPRGTREEGKREMLEESSSNNRGFTVQFLPERLAGILAQAERYARQTLLPLISQYTPSFIGGGGRTDKPKYFPPLGNLFGVRDEEVSTEIRPRNQLGDSNDSRTKYYLEFDEASSTTSRNFPKTSTETLVVEIERQRVAHTSIASTGNVEKKIKDSWVPLAVTPPTDNLRDKSFDGDRTGQWLNEGGVTWSTPSSNDTSSTSETVITETKIDDWVPIVPLDSSKSGAPAENSSNHATPKVDRKFIPLMGITTSTASTVNEESRETTENKEKKIPQGRSIVFPYVYERKNDPRTRYIPLIPKEDLGLSGVLKRDRKR